MCQEDDFLDAEEQYYFNALGKQKSSVFFWCCIMVATMLFAFMSAFVRVDIIVRPDFYKSRNENSK